MIYLVRHGEAASGWGHAADPGLSDLGHAQAEAVAEILEGFDIQNAFASPMARCQETSKPFAKLSGLPVSTEPLVTEIPTPEGLADRVAWLRGFMSGDWGAALPLIAAWKARLIEKVASLPDQSVVFTHFIAINSVVGHLSGDDRVTVFRPGHCSITQLERTDTGLRVAERGAEAATKVL